MTRQAVDALYASNIAEGIDSGAINPQIVLGYVYRDGGAVWSASDWNLSQFDNRLKGTITTNASYAADIWDAETGDGQPSDITTFRATCTNAGMVWCTVYAGKYQWLPEIQDIIASEHLTNINIWDSDATGVPHLNAGSVATQYAVDSQLHAGYDLSLSVNSPLWYGIDPVPDPKHFKVNEMLIVGVNPASTTQQAVLLMPDGKKYPIAGASDLTALVNAGIPYCAVSEAFYTALVTT